MMTHSHLPILILALLAFPSWSAPAPIAKPVQVSHHRGALKYAPENTFPAFEKSIELGADYIEFDVQRSSAGVYYLLHDSTLDRTTNGTGPISETSSEVIEGLDAGSWFSERFKGERVPTLDAFLERFAGRVGLYLDAKAIDPEDLVDALRRFNALDSTVVYGDVDFLARLKEIEPGIRSIAPLSRIEEIQPIMERLAPYGFDCSWSALSKELIDRCHALGVKVFSDALGADENHEEALRAIEWGIDLIQTDHPDRLQKAIDEYIARRLTPRLVEGGEVRQTDPPSRRVVLEKGVVEVDGKRIDFEAQEFEIEPEPPIEVPDQLYRLSALTTRKSPAFWDGEGPRGPGTQKAYQRMVPGSLVVSSTDGSKVFRSDVDYIYDYHWGTIKPASGGAMLPNMDVRIAYRAYRCRYDALVIDGAGKVSFLPGDSMPDDPTELLLPNPPAVPAGSLLLAHIFTGWTNEAITEGGVGPIVPSETNPSQEKGAPRIVNDAYHDILPRDFLIRIERPGPVGAASYRTAASGDPYGIDPPRTLDDPRFGPEVVTSATRGTPLLFPVSSGGPADYSLRIDFSPLVGVDLKAGEEWRLSAEPKMIFRPDLQPLDFFPEAEVLKQRERIQRTLDKLEKGERVTVVYLGESTTAGGYWPALFTRGLQDLYPRSVVEGINVGIGGENILGGLPRLESDVFSKNPDLVIIEYVINDSSMNYHHDPRKGPGPVEMAHRELTAKVRERGGIDLVYLTANMGNPAFGPAFSFENFRRMADFYRSLCDEVGAAFVDAFQVWEQMDRVHGEYFITRLKGNMVNHPYANQDKPWSADGDNADFLLRLFDPGRP